MELILSDDSYEIRPLDILQEPETKTQATVINLQSYEIVNTENDSFISGSHGIQLELAQ